VFPGEQVAEGETSINDLIAVLGTAATAITPARIFTALHP
jgi:hypothetical protein